MVPANDVQEPEPTAPQITAGNKPPTASADSSARLTSLPPWAMHWWTPLLLAGILLAAGCFLASIWRMPLRPVSWWKINLYWPPSWPFNYHWPSRTQWPCAQQLREQASHSRLGSRGATIML